MENVGNAFCYQALVRRRHKVDSSLGRGRRIVRRTHCSVPFIRRWPSANERELVAASLGGRKEPCWSIGDLMRWCPSDEAIVRRDAMSMVEVQW